MLGTVSGLAYNAALIPAGSAGSANKSLRNTSEQPGGSDGTGSFRTECSYSHMNNDDLSRPPFIEVDNSLHHNPSPATPSQLAPTQCSAEYVQ